MELNGKHVGQYQLLSLIALGGTAEVYKGYHPTLDRHVVIKLLAREYAQDSDWIRRFRQEARLLGKLDHPNILSIFDAGEHDGRPYLVTKWIENGVTLRTLMNDAPWPQDRVVNVVRQIGEALQAAHEAGLVHRDVKPSNVLVSPGDHCLVFDFGLAKPLRRREFSTQEGIIVGTPEYMSPEQCRGEEVDERSDVYALGVVTYEMFMGRVPFQAPSPVGILMKHLTESLPPLAEAAPLSHLQHAVITRAMDRSRVRRFASAREFARALAVASGQSPTATIEVTAPPTRRTRWWRRSRELPSPRRMVAVFMGATVGLFAAAVSLMWFLLASSAVELPVPPRDELPRPATPLVAVAPENSVPGPPSMIAEEAPARSRAPSSRVASLPVGSIAIDTNLPASVLLDGRKLGTAPGVFREVAPGRYVVTLDAGAGLIWQRDIIVSAGSQARLTHRFEKMEGKAEAPVLPVFRRSFSPEKAAPTTIQPTRFAGHLTDSQCKLVGATDGHWRCLQRCLREGAQPLLFWNGKLYPLDGIDRIRGDRNRQVTFEGVLDASGRIVVSQPR